MPSSSSANLWGMIAAVSWVVWMIPNFVFGWHLWWLVFIPIVLSSIAGQQKEELKRREKLWRKQQPQLPPGSPTDRTALTFGKEFPAPFVSRLTLDTVGEPS